MRYIVAAMTIVNDLHYADGTRRDNVPGGGIYCLGGIKPFCDDVGYVTVAGDDFDQYYGDFFARNGYTTRGVLRRLPHTHHNRVQYQADGRWQEFSLYGEEVYQSWAGPTQITGDDIAALAGPGTRGIYTESGLEEAFWHDEELAKMRKAAPNAKIMWELPYNNVMVPEERARFPENVHKCDIYSVNLAEGRVIFGKQREEDVVEAILKLGVPCFFRCGTRGSYMIAEGRAVFAPSVGVEESVDPTGCGNCSTCTALYAWAEGMDFTDIVAFANVTAYYNALQLGPVPLYSPAMQQTVRRHAAQYARQLKTGGQGG